MSFLFVNEIFSLFLLLLLPGRFRVERGYDVNAQRHARVDRSAAQVDLQHFRLALLPFLYMLLIVSLVSHIEIHTTTTIMPLSKLRESDYLPILRLLSTIFQFFH